MLLKKRKTVRENIQTVFSLFNWFNDSHFCAPKMTERGITTLSPLLPLPRLHRFISFSREYSTAMQWPPRYTKLGQFVIYTKILFFTKRLTLTCFCHAKVSEVDELKCDYINKTARSPQFKSTLLYSIILYGRLVQILILDLSTFLSSWSSKPKSSTCVNVSRCTSARLEPKWVSFEFFRVSLKHSFYCVR